MQSNTDEKRHDGWPLEQPLALGQLVLVRAAADQGAGRAAIVRDLTPLVSHKLSPGEWRGRAEAEIAALEAKGLIATKRGRLAATEAGLAHARGYLGGHACEAAWAEVRDVLLVAKALGIENESAQQLKALVKPEGLRALILQKAYELPLKGKQSASQLRSDLAIVALRRAFGNKLKTAQGAGLSAKMGRVLAGQLSARPQDFGTDGRLIERLAAERAGAVQTDADALRLALLRNFVSELVRPVKSQPGAETARPVSLPPAANDTRPLTAPMPPPKAVRPDLPTFAAEVREAAKGKAEGWPGNRKAFISHVWQTIRASRPDWSLTEIEFKCMLAEAHRAGSIQLANADLKDKRQIQELQESAIPYKNVVWHFVRVEG